MFVYFVRVVKTSRYRLIRLCCTCQVDLSCIRIPERDAYINTTDTRPYTHA